MGKRVYIFDTTLRDGEQSPGVSLNTEEKLQIARQLERLQVDVIEAGFPVSSQGDFEAVRAIAREIRGASIAGLTRSNEKEILRTWEALKEGENPRIHTFLATSDIHMQHKLKMTPDQVLERVKEAVSFTKRLTSNIEFSAEDASRSEINFLCRVLEVAIKAGATVLNVPDTVGYSLPYEFGDFVKYILNNVEGIEKVILSIHCHNDLGMAVANSLAAVKAGATQIEGAINGIGERAGNASLEEVIMALCTRKDQYQVYTNIKTEEIYRSSKLVSSLTGMSIQPNKAVVGKNAFAHESGIHQDGVLKQRSTYEIMNPEAIGIQSKNLILGKSSGRHAFKDKLEELGYFLSSEELNKAFKSFKNLADRKKTIADEDLEAIVEEEISLVPTTYELKYIQILTGSTMVPTATVGLLKGEDNLEEASCGNGPVDAICHAVDKLTGLSCVLASWAISSVTSGKDALGEVTLRITEDGEKIYVGKGISTDILEASAKAYVNAVNKLLWDKEKNSKNQI